MAETPRSKRGKALVLAGVLLLAAALAWTAYNLMDAQRAERSVTQALEALEEMEPTPPPATSPAQDPAPGETPADPDQPMPTVEVEGNGYIGRLDLPGLGLSLPVLDQWSTDLLKLAPCRYQGSASQQDLIIAGHNYRSHFGRLNQAQVGDAVRFTDGGPGPPHPAVYPGGRVKRKPGIHRKMDAWFCISRVFYYPLRSRKSCPQLIFRFPKKLRPLAKFCL